MNHLVLARKYRPQTFSEVMGQDSAVNALQYAIEHNRVAHALLFCGARGIGKTTLARLVAKALVCESNKKPCNTCVQCQSINNFNSLDVMEIDGASNTSIDDVRDLRENAKYQPALAKYKIFIIDEVHMLSQSAFNALLKILEEPPAHIIFIFATTEAHKLPKTILSRCQRYDLKKFSNAIIIANLKNILQKEKYHFEDSAIFLLAKLADGSMRDALSLLEQTLLLGEKTYTETIVAQALGAIEQDSIKKITQALIKRDTKEALKITHSIYEKGLDLSQLMQEIAQRIRLFSLIAHVPKNMLHKNISLDIYDEDIEECKEYNQQELRRCFAISLDGIEQVFKAYNTLMAIELVILRFTQRAQMKEAIEISTALQKLESLINNRPSLPQITTEEVKEKKNSTLI